ncbi:CLUMA_CG015623, isoform A [Clunio marinus]|uniref:CLUMA_CG015623, isoform A n=1 Tax=Clunio marinus TaxID=568069 RepID=A0A1J1IV14_9DIPT|nr:CLUMA_CG015623, isoform A [Clunio marinus]
MTTLTNSVKRFLFIMLMCRVFFCVASEEFAKVSLILNIARENFKSWHKKGRRNEAQAQLKSENEWRSNLSKSTKQMVRSFVGIECLQILENLSKAFAIEYLQVNIHYNGSGR